MRRCVRSLFLASALTVACSSPDAQERALAHVSSPVVYGGDDRRDPYAESDPELAALATSSAAALISPTLLRFSDSDVAVRAAPLSARDDYCPGTSFLDQPTAATCSAVLIDDDLLLTAGHCLETVPSCRDFAYVFNYAYAAEGVLGPIARSDVYGCRSVVVQESSPPDSATQVDFAIIALDRSVVGRTPVTLAPPSPVATGDAVTVIGSPSGLPVKLDAGAQAVDSRAPDGDFFTLTSDTFAGSSGSGVYSGQALVGVFARGTTDFVNQGGCRAERVVSDLSMSGESATYAARAIETLCASGFPSERLCGSAPRCGDGVCSAETAETCPEDCAPPACGDKLCEEPEWSSCPEDCGDRRPAGLPDGWYCEPLWYGDGRTCDCACGATDSDCGAGMACESVGPTGLEPQASRVSAHGGCSVTGSQAPSKFGAIGAIFLVAAVLRRRQLRRPLKMLRSSVLGLTG